MGPCPCVGRVCVGMTGSGVCLRLSFLRRGCGASRECEGFSLTRGVMPIYDGFDVNQGISLPGDPRVPG